MGDNNQSIGPGMYFNTALYNFAQAAGSTPQSGDTAYGLASAMIGGGAKFLCSNVCCVRIESRAHWPNAFSQCTLQFRSRWASVRPGQGYS